MLERVFTIISTRDNRTVQVFADEESAAMEAARLRKLNKENGWDGDYRIGCLRVQYS